LFHCRAYNDKRSNVRTALEAQLSIQQNNVYCYVKTP